MVAKGQYLERATLIPVERGLVLEGVSHRGAERPGVLVVPPLPGEGGMDHVAGAEIAFAVSRAGHQCLRFNFRGVGASQGQVARDDEALLEDAKAAWELARDNAEGAAPLLVSLGGSDRIVRRLLGEVEVAGWALVHPALTPFEPEVPHVVVLPELDDPGIRRGWSAVLGEGALALVLGADRSYLRNLPQVGKAVATLARRLGASTGNP